MTGPRKMVLLSLAVSIGTMGLKTAAWWWTGSAGLLSDAAESLVNVAAAAIAYIALTVSAQPADDGHPFGHDKVEYFSSGAEGMLIIVAASGIIWAAVERVLHPAPLTDLGWGLGVSVGASVLNFITAQALLRAGRRYDSIVLEADGKHLMTDVWTSLGVVAGLGVVLVRPQWSMLDPVIALLMGANIVFSGWQLVRRSFGGLMDRALPADEVAQVEDCIRKAVGHDAEFHGLRTRKSGARRFVDFHLLVPGEMSVQESHDLTLAVERELAACLPRIQATIHVEPLEDGHTFDEENGATAHG